jgi:hypothetical protein
MVAALAVTATCGFAGAADAATFQPGDLLLQDNLYEPDETRWLRADGTFVAAIPAGGYLAFDGHGRLYSMETFSRHVFAYRDDGSLLGTHIEIPGPCDDASGLTFDAVGNAYVGEFSACFGDGLRKFDPSGRFLGYPFPSSFEADFLDLASDQCTLYTMDANRRAVRKTNVCTGQISGFFAIGLAAPESHELRVARDGSVLLNFHGVIFRLHPDGQLLQVIEHPQQCDGEPFVWDPADDDWDNENQFRGLTLSPSGDTFWSSCRIGGEFVPLEIDIASEAVVRTLSGETGFVSAVAGGFYAAHDHTAPSVDIEAPLDGAVYRLGEAVSAQYACADAGGAGLASCEGSVPSGALVDTSSIGAKTFTVNAADGAGNTATASVSYRVVYRFTGFFEPVDNPPAFNVMPAGKSVRVLFRLGGYQGLSIFQPGYPTSHRTSCDPSAPQNAVEETTSARGDTLSYDTATGRYAYVFRTFHAWSNRCRELVLRFVDGTEQSVLFRLT